MEAIPTVPDIQEVRSVQTQISNSYRAKKFAECLELVNSAIDLLKHHKPTTTSISNLEIQLRSFKGHLLSTTFSDHFLAEKQFKICQNIDPFHPLLLRRKGQHHLKGSNYQQSLQCYKSLLLAEPESRYIQNKIKQVQKLLNEEKQQTSQECIKEEESPTTGSVRFGSFQIIQINDSYLDNDESQARIQKGVEGLSKSTKSILKDTFSGHSSNNQSNQDGVKNEVFQYKKIKSIQKVGMKVQELDELPDTDSKVKFKKQHSMYQKEVSIQKDEGVESPFPKSEKKPILKKSKSVAFRSQEYKQ